MNKTTSSIAQKHLDTRIQEKIEFKGIFADANRVNYMIKIREKVEKLCRIGDTGTYEDPEKILASFKKEFGSNILNDEVGQWIYTYQQMQNGLNEHSVFSEESILTSKEYIQLVEMAEAENIEREEEAKQKKYFEKYTKLFTNINTINVPNAINIRYAPSILNREIYETDYQTGYLFWKNIPSLPKLLQSKKLKGISEQFDRILLVAQGYMYFDLLNKEVDITKKHKIILEWEEAQKALLAQNNPNVNE